jgi:RimJ/RimL family protein N-acetyltransferase
VQFCENAINISKSMKLESERLILRQINLNDKSEIFAYRSDKVTNEYQGWIPNTIGDVEIFIEKIAKQINEPETWYQFVLIEKESQKIIGDLGIHFWDKENKQVEIGCTLNKNYQKKGFAIESLKRVIDYLFNELNKHRIITSIAPENEDSIRLVERIGFRKEAHFVESIFVNEKWVDDLVYSLLEKDWKKITLKNKT